MLCSDSRTDQASIHSRSLEYPDDLCGPAEKHMSSVSSGTSGCSSSTSGSGCSGSTSSSGCSSVLAEAVAVIFPAVPVAMVVLAVAVVVPAVAVAVAVPVAVVVLAVAVAVVALAALGACDRDFFPNIHFLLVVGCTLPISSAEAERSFSLMRRIKTYARSVMTEERFSDQALISMHIKSTC